MAKLPNPASQSVTPAGSGTGETCARGSIQRLFTMFSSGAKIVKPSGKRNAVPVFEKLKVLPLSKTPVACVSPAPNAPAVPVTDMDRLKGARQSWLMVGNSIAPIRSKARFSPGALITPTEFS